MRSNVLLCLLGLLLLPACGSRSGGGGGGGDDDDSGPAPDDDDTDPFDGEDPEGPCDDEGASGCDGWQWYVCNEGEWALADECLPPTPICDHDMGCLACQPGFQMCDGNAIVQCDEDGQDTTWIQDCPADAPCVGGVCLDACTVAASQFSYLGCEFVAASTANTLDPTFGGDFAVVVANPQGADGAASVTVTRGGLQVGSILLQPGQTNAITLPMVPELSESTGSVTVGDAAYIVQSDQPIAAYQYNPLHFELSAVNSFSNDASLLLPVHTLTGNYMVSSLPSFGVGYSAASPSWAGFLPGFFAIVGTEDGTSITLTYGGQTAAGIPAAHSAGDTEVATLGRGDVIQVLGWAPDAATAPQSACTDAGWQTTQASDVFGNVWTHCLGPGTDLTGTTISATAPVAVFAGHQCSFVPFTAWACDHLEEMMFPTETWGVRAVMTAPRFPGGSGVAATRYRVLALNGGTGVTFDPPVSSAATLGAGDFVEFTTDQDFVVDGTGPIYVTQFMQGQDALGASIGDPAMGSGIPWVQVRADYDFLTPDTYTENYVNVVAPTGTDIALDGAPVSGFQAIGTTGFSVARVPVYPGGHHIASVGAARFGITTYGYAPYTSYLYPGGLNFGRSSNPGP